MPDAFRIRPVMPDDAAALYELKSALDAETRFMLIEPGERRDSPANVAEQLERIGDQENSTILVAEIPGTLLGYVEAQGGDFRRNRHCAYVVIGVRQSAAGAGIGTALMSELSAWAERHGVHRLELTVMADNERAIALYRRSGYEIEGIRRDSLHVEGSYVDELAMARLADG